MSKIFSRTLETTLKLVSIIVCVVVGIIVGSVVSSFGKDQTTIGVYHVLLENSLMLQHLLVFFVIDGFLLMVLTISNATGLIASEVHEGTFKLLAAKPNSRTQILTGKILGVILGLIILLLISLFSYFSTVIIADTIDGNIIKEMVAFLPAYFLYGLAIILILTGVSTLLSCIFKRKITAMLPLLAIMVITLGFFPIQRVMSMLSGSSPAAALKFIDTNYHFALIFKLFVEMVETIKPHETLAYLMNLFSVYLLDPDVTRIDWGGKIMLANKSLSAVLVLMFYSIAAMVSYFGSYVLIKKKDI